MKKSLLFGLHRISGGRVWVVEAEIDALTLVQRGDHVVAVGGSDFSDEQARELALAGVEEVVLGGDNDAAGRKLNEMVREKMRRYGVKALDCEWPADAYVIRDGERRLARDPNELLEAGRLDDLRVIEKRGLTLGRGRCA
jgi:DNA primase